MRWHTGLAVLLTATAAIAQEPPKLTKLKEWEAACNELRTKALKVVEAESLVIPDRLVVGDGIRLDADKAWQEKLFEEARAGYAKVWKQYAGAIEGARADHARLLALRRKKVPPLKLPFKQRKAIQGALAWLAGHQDAIGRWDCVGFTKHDAKKPQFAGPGIKGYDIGVTALALLAFLEAGYTDRDNHYALEVRRGLNWLLAQQHFSGTFGRWESQSFQYRHATATIAIARAYALTKDERFRTPLLHAVDFTLRARKGGKGWRYAPEEGDSDTSLTCWCYRALDAVRAAGIELDLKEAAKGARSWIDGVTSSDGRIGYLERNGGSARPAGMDRYPSERTRAMTAAGTLVRILVGGDQPDRTRILQSLDACLERPPIWSDDGDVDMYYWYHGSLAFQFDENRARRWKTHLHKAVLKNQERKGVLAGSWPPVGAWGRDGGRVYSTAILALALLHAE
ncbi:MAG: PDDEXK family nuclease [Planctomycetota bacterium]|jgi:hypothetical protein